MASLNFCVRFEKSGSVFHMIEFGLHAEVERRLALESLGSVVSFNSIGPFVEA